MELSMSILVVEDAELVREYWRETLSDAGFEVAAVGSGEDALRWAKGRSFNLGIIDIGLPGISGIALLRALTKSHPDARFLVLTALNDSELIMEALKGGAKGYVLKEASVEEVLDCISSVLQGTPSLSSGVGERLVEFLNGKGLEESSCNDEDLTPREREILGLLARGMTYSEVASALTIGVGTVQTHVKSLYGKLGVASKTEAAALAITKRLI